ncbi:MAG: glutamate--tRNA ligase family protein [Candidatus Heimdallarchaeota archaeon]|nr:glutamate--tRNA ligase family protein [Candidatus Heimdallarchaeota archaeon]
MSNNAIPEETLELLKQEITAQSLLNAKLYKGKPNGKAVIGKIMSTKQEFRKYAANIKELVDLEINRITQLTLLQIEQELNEIAPNKEEQYLNKKKMQIEERKSDPLKALPNAKEAEVVLRYAPDPSKFPHLGQGINYLINRMYADKYKGKIILRFDDTNPAIVKEEYYKAIKAGMKWLGATWDKEIKASQHIDKFHQVAEQWITQQLLYACFCQGEVLSKNREEGNACEHRNQSIDQNLKIFQNIQNNKYTSGQVVLRLVGDLTSDNNVMRDPIMFRIVDQQHPLLDKFYPLFPTYDFESAYFEATEKITHVVRSGEFGTMRQELQSYLITKLGGKVPEFVSFGRVNIQGCPTKGRVIRELVTDNIVTGWDDIRLITLAGLKKRGIQPETIRQLAIEVGLSPQNTKIAWSTLETKSKQNLEKTAKRLYFVPNPVNLHVTDGTEREITLPYHPLHEDYGNRTIFTNGHFKVAKSDVMNLSIGSIFRLKDLYNVEITEKSKDGSIIGIYKGEEIIAKTPKIQWVGPQAVDGELDVPDLLENEQGEINPNSMHKMKGSFEENIRNIPKQEVIQLERVGFAKIDKNTKKKIEGNIVHLH